MKIHYLQHDDLVQACTIEQWATEQGILLSNTQVHKGEAFPDTSDFDLLIILGGRMGAYEEDDYPWLIDEKAFIKRAIAENKYVLGLCLGAQILADVLGGLVHPHVHKEIGWWPVHFSPQIEGTLLQGLPEMVHLFEFHGDTFTLPAGVKLLASSEGCENQAFIYNDRVLAVQFHPEVSVEKMKVLAEAVGNVEGPYSQPAAHYMNEQAYFEQSKEVMFTILCNFKEQIKLAEVML